MPPLVDEFTSVYKHAVCFQPFYICIIPINDPLNKPVITFNPAVNVTYKKCIKELYSVMIYDSLFTSEKQPIRTALLALSRRI